MGIGPGGLDELTPRARRAIATAEVVVGYRAYLSLIASLLDGQEAVATGMREEIERARVAVERAQKGVRVAVVSGGDPGVYGMAAPVLEAAARAGVADRVEVIPGITAAAAAAALLGAPIGHDFAVVSLSDLLTPWEVIERRLRAAAAADFVIVLYNPASTRRNWQFARACAVTGEYRDQSTPVGIVWDAGRPEQRTVVTTLGAAPEEPVDMRAVVVVGSSQTRVVSGRLVTPRGYRW